MFYYSGDTLGFLQLGDSFEVSSGAIIEKHLQGQIAYSFTNWPHTTRVAINFSGSQSLNFLFSHMEIRVSNGQVAVGPGNRFTIYYGNVGAGGSLSRNIYIEGGTVDLQDLFSLSPMTGYIRVNGGYVIISGIARPAPLGEYRGSFSGWERVN